MRCNQCNRFTSYAGDEEPEIEEARINRAGELEIEVRIVKNCGECGEELKEAQFILAADLTTALESEGIAVDTWADLSIRATADSTEEIRKGITYYGVAVTWEVRDRPYGRFIAGPGAMNGEIAASHMDELVWARTGRVLARSGRWRRWRR